MPQSYVSLSKAGDTSATSYNYG